MRASYDRLLVWLLGAAVIGAVLQITLGGVVRVTGSGLGCPDWPLCHGSIIPVFRDYHTAIEWSHRLTGTLLGVTLVLAAARIWLHSERGRGVNGIWLRKDRDPVLARLSLAALVLVVIVGGIGGGVVLTELDPGIRTVHLALAEGALLVIAAGWVAASYLPGEGPASVRAERRSLFRASAIAALAVLIALLSGSYAVWRGAGAVCPSWPLCGGAVVPDSSLTWIHMTHRLLAGAGAALALWAAHRAYRIKGAPTALRRASLGGLVLVAAQVLVGAANPWTGFDEWARALHLSLATLLWLDMALIALLIVRPVRRGRPRRPQGETAALAAGGASA